jgi:hypothetical protein
LAPTLPNSSATTGAVGVPTDANSIAQTPTALEGQTASTEHPTPTLESTYPSTIASDTYDLPNARYTIINDTLYRYDLDGNVVWQESVGTVSDWAIDDAHTVYVTDGSTTTAYDVDGVELWSSSYGADVLDVNENGHCYLTTNGSGAETVTRLDVADGSLVWQEESLLYDGTSGTGIDASGNLYKTTQSLNTIEKVTPDGTRSIFDDDAYGGPDALVVHPDGQSLSFESSQNNELITIDVSDGTITSQMPTSGAIEFVGFDGDGHLYIYDYTTPQEIRKLDLDTETVVWSNSVQDSAWKYLGASVHPTTNPIVIEADGTDGGQAFYIRELDPDDGTVVQTIDTFDYSSTKGIKAHPQRAASPSSWTDYDGVTTAGIVASGVEASGTVTTPEGGAQASPSVAPPSTATSLQMASGGATATPSAGGMTQTATVHAPTATSMATSTGTTVSTTATPSTSTGNRGVEASATVFSVDGVLFIPEIAVDAPEAQTLVVTLQSATPTVTATSDVGATPISAAGAPTATESTGLNTVPPTSLSATVGLTAVDAHVGVASGGTLVQTTASLSDPTLSAGVTPLAMGPTQTVSVLDPTATATASPTSPVVVAQTAPRMPTLNGRKHVAATPYRAEAIPNTALEFELRARPIRSGPNRSRVDVDSNSAHLETDRPPK